MISTLVTAATSSDLTEIYDYLASFTQLVTLLIGAALVASTIIAGIQYTTAGGSSEKVEKAKGRLASNVIVLAIYVFSAAVLNWLLPG